MTYFLVALKNGRCYAWAEARIQIEKDTEMCMIYVYFKDMCYIQQNRL